MESSRVTHIFTHLVRLGGVQTMLQRHLEATGPGPPQEAVIIFEPTQRPRTVGLGLRGWNSPRTAQLQWAQKVPPIGGSAVYHNGWGASFLAAQDGCQRRIALWHSPWPGVEHNLTALRGAFDYVMTVNRPLAELTGRLLGLPAERLIVVPVPIDPPVAPPPERPHWKGRPLVMGFAGRLVHAQKRVERLPELAERLTAAGVTHRWEILGDGPARQELAQLFAAGNVPVNFRGRVGGEAYWNLLRQLDFIVFTSDYEGMPISLLEAMSQGVLPLYAEMQSGGDDYTRQLHPPLLYPVQRPDEAAKALRELLDISPDALKAMQSRARTLALAHADDAYSQVFAEGLRRAEQLPRVSLAQPPPAGSRFGRRIPFALLGRLSPGHPLRRGLV